MPAGPLLPGLAAIVGLFSLLWVASLRLRNASIVDTWWGPGFLVATIVSLGAASPAHPRAWVAAAAVVLWAVRLAAHIGLRNSGHGEDPRYAAWREQYGAQWWWWSYFHVFLLQAVIAWVVSWPVFFAVTRDAAFPTVLDAAGVGLFATGWLFETVGDWQLARFKRNPANRGQVFDRGLWKYTRHPNYFGEAVPGGGSA
ncbi:MAG: DUF1295 domain-containing protein [Vicinamibacterales bacterium]